MQAQGNEERVLLLLQFDSATQIHSLRHKDSHTLPAPDANTHTHTCTDASLYKMASPFSRHTFEEPRNIFVCFLLKAPV